MISIIPTLQTEKQQCTARSDTSPKRTSRGKAGYKSQESCLKSHKPSMKTHETVSWFRYQLVTGPWTDQGREPFREPKLQPLTPASATSPCLLLSRSAPGLTAGGRDPTPVLVYTAWPAQLFGDSGRARGIARSRRSSGSQHRGRRTRIQGAPSQAGGSLVRETPSGGVTLCLARQHRCRPSASAWPRCPTSRRQLPLFCPPTRPQRLRLENRAGPGRA